MNTTHREREKKDDMYNVWYTTAKKKGLCHICRKCMWSTSVMENKEQKHALCLVLSREYEELYKSVSMLYHSSYFMIDVKGKKKKKIGFMDKWINGSTQSAITQFISRTFYFSVCKQKAPEDVYISVRMFTRKKQADLLRKEGRRM